TFDPTGFVAGLGYSKIEFLTYLIIGVVFFGSFTVVSGPLAEKLGRRKMLLGVTVLIAAYGPIVNALVNAGTAGVIIALIVGFIRMRLSFGPMAACLPELFRANVRYAGSAVSYSMSSVSGAGPAPVAMVALWQAEGGTIFYCGLYIIGAAILALVALYLAKDTSALDMEDQLS